MSAVVFLGRRSIDGWLRRRARKNIGASRSFGTPLGNDAQSLAYCGFFAGSFDSAVTGAWACVLDCRVR